MVILSENPSYDTVTVHNYQTIIIEHFKGNLLLYGWRSQHFQNKYRFTNLLHQEQDFGIPAVCHIHATPQDKETCDGTGGNLKRLTAKPSLQRSSKNQILNAHALLAWIYKSHTETVVPFNSKENHAEMSLQL